MSIKLAIYFTAQDGSTAEISGDQNALDAIEKLFEESGVKFNETLETWDAGFYSNGQW